MAYPFGKLPTLREFIQKAVEQGCQEKVSKYVVRGTRGEMCPRYLTRSSSDSPPYILPNMKDNERLTPTVLESLVRVLKVKGYEHLLLGEPESYDD